MKASFVLCWCSVVFVCGANAYKAGVIDSPDNEASDIVPLVYKAGEQNVDVLVLSSHIANSEDNYDKIVKDLSNAAKQAGLYLVAHLNEKAVCQKKHEIVRSNLVFDREGSIVSVYRKPVTTTANCTTPTAGLATFTTDFGVTFGVMMEEDLVLKSLGDLKGLRDFVVTGAWVSEIPFLSASQFIPAWAYTVNANVLSKNGIIAGAAGVKNIETDSGRVLIARLTKNIGKEAEPTPPVVNPASLKNFPGEDLNQYIIRPLDIEASSQGYTDTVCHNNFCCEFNVKTSLKGSKQEANYGLASFDGVRHYGGAQYIGAQNCAIFACAGIYKRSCRFGSINNSTNITFERLTVTANFTKENSNQYPVILSNDRLPADRFNFLTKSDRNVKQVTVEINDVDNLLTFGIFGRDFENDYLNLSVNQDGGQGIYEYIFSEDLQDFFDYVWIRLRILMFIVSIYVLEMM